MGGCLGEPTTAAVGGSAFLPSHHSGHTIPMYNQQMSHHHPSHGVPTATSAEKTHHLPIAPASAVDVDTSSLTANGTAAAPRGVSSGARVGVGAGGRSTSGPLGGPHHDRHQNPPTSVSQHAVMGGGGGGVASYPMAGAPGPANSHHVGIATVTGIEKNTANTAIAPRPEVALPPNPITRPAIALSAHIMTSYHAINALYHYERKLGRFEDSMGSLEFVSGALIADRYQVELMLGKGSFGTVFQCVDICWNQRVAVKVIRSGMYFERQGMTEAKLLQHMKKNANLKNLVVSLKEVTEWRGHVVLVFELLSFNLFQLLYQTKFNGVSLDLVRKFTWQLLQVFLQLEQHDPPIIHCDLKPENVSLVTPDRSAIRVIDFGSAQLQTPQVMNLKRHHRISPAENVHNNHNMNSHANTNHGSPHHTRVASGIPMGGGGGGTVGTTRHSAPATNCRQQASSTTSPQVPPPPSLKRPTTSHYAQSHVVWCPRYIQSRYYRSPEVILELGYTTAIDRWSLACMLVELHTGRPLFQGVDEADMLARFVDILGPIPNRMIDASPRKDYFFISTSHTHTAANAWESNTTREAVTPSPPSRSATPEAAASSSSSAGGMDRRQAKSPPHYLLRAHRSPPTPRPASPSAVHPPPSSPSGPQSHPHPQHHQHQHQHRDRERDPHPGHPSQPVVMQATTSLEAIIGVTTGGPRGCRREQDGHDEASYRVFLDFITRLLAYEPEQRMTCLEATQHPFLAPFHNV